jgi:hypothetical protein
MPEPWDTVHPYVVPITFPLKDIPGEVSLQIVWLAGVAVTTGRGLTVTTTFVPVPPQLLALGVT